MNRKVLIIEDNKLDCLLHKKACTKVGLQEPVIFYNGLEALQYIKEEFTGATELLVLLDINMPVMNGWEFLDNLPAVRNKANTFIAIVSSSFSEADRAKAQQYELVQEYFVKPLSIGKLSQLVNQPFLNGFKVA
ncbi:Response regulator receiver domain-containing protein [Arenibacter nanhaiticus]|uniref:Response regulator receiver domain-containing protein n=1 Tax=Arenibacter nanhaiticus TaxID=558155 RepID=A0A1M6GAT4_9FLAO|nr:response regulator [Arenibacter nanhaiticus]SHJ07060.1 Response regulator receiver domain-containing protein [Arenibacter nanhaiticus]